MRPAAAIAPEHQQALALLGDHVRRAREARGVAKLRLCKDLGMDRIHYAGFENGEANISVIAFLRIVEYLQMPQDEIIPAHAQFKALLAPAAPGVPTVRRSTRTRT